MASKIDLQDHTILVLPFTPSLLRDPSPLYSPILDILPRSSKKSFTVFFSTPAGAISSEQSAIQSISGVGSNQEQLYSLLRRAPQESFKALQSFLGHIYTALWTAQWKCENVLLDVEVHFEGESGELDAKLLRGKDGEEEYQLIKVEGVQETDLVASLDQIIPSPFTSLSLPYATLSSHQSEPYILEERQSPGFPVVALGGTFDRLHAAHKLLLHLGYFLAREKLIVGVMADDLLHTKTRADLVQPLNQRLDGVNAFLGRLGDGSIKLNVVEIHDALGPTRSDPNVQALVVSRETLSGGEYVNSTRKEGGLQELELFVVDVIAENGDVNLKEEMDEGKLKKMKMGSTGVRNWIAERGTGEQDR
ncbi:pantetheine-phosphate adenylyltransferase, putative [Cryptococcus deneoformans JEC21]|uniref:Pantetheine-phosphate adenylyltransferase, putative n=1 Tax=Cryptococcus deneoformans (strain JEC21 / ATCC MYA-565) TaxID=214684 RepID=Q5KMA7_CRYD1|nr:pantetheine-phosphate adenylyltransferase, putative [Cryptococcus neoformans var. neoformans JEC21]AAW41699.2 pantetheine-phosphate adenylyltransferase, putative [Cryptococcus neoformans var. neoformans JEC21]